MVRPDHLTAVAARAEDAGYESVFVPDHVVFPVGATACTRTPRRFAPVRARHAAVRPVRAALAARTGDTHDQAGDRGLRAGAAPPVRRAVTTLDVLSGGRAVLGVGAGWFEGEFTALGLDPRTRFSRTEEAVTVLRELWTRRAVVPRSSLRLRPGPLRAQAGERAASAHPPRRRLARASRGGVRRRLDLGGHRRARRRPPAHARRAARPARHHVRSTSPCSIRDHRSPSSSSSALGVIASWSCRAARARPSRGSRRSPRRCWPGRRSTADRVVSGPWRTSERRS